MKKSYLITIDTESGDFTMEIAKPNTDRFIIKYRVSGTSVYDRTINQDGKNLCVLLNVTEREAWDFIRENQEKVSWDSIQSNMQPN